VKILPGSILKLFMDGKIPVTSIVIDLRTEPYRLPATSVYVVVVPGEIVLVPMEDTVPMPGLIETEFAPLTSQCKVAS